MGGPGAAGGLIRLRSEGRGRSYSVLRGLVESSLRIAYQGNWPRALWQQVPGACRVAVTRHRLALLPAGSPPLRLGFISDVHLGPTTPEPLLDAAFAHLAEARVDLLLLGGDYVFLDATPDKMRSLGRRVAAVPAARKLAVLGNHDLWTLHDEIERSLESAGVEMIVNRAVVAGGVSVVGLDDPWTGALDARAAFAGVAPDRPVVILCHSPDGLPEARAALARLPAAPPSLFVCGHTHGGQVATPWGPIIIPSIVGKQYPSGLFHLPDLSLFVSRGVGGVEVPMRSWASPEVAVFELTARPAGA